MNSPCEQLRYDLSVEVAKDQPLTTDAFFYVLSEKLGKNNVSRQKLMGKNVIVYEQSDKKIVLLTKNITYLGNPHPIYKKRIQLPDWYQSFYSNLKTEMPEYDVKFLGIYHYNGNYIFVDFLKDTYLKHGLHNSSAHVYINDLYQAMIYGVFQKEDKNSNNLVALRADKLKDYLSQSVNAEVTLFDLFREFNCGFSFGHWLYALDIIKEMHQGKWTQWRQTEWAGWFLEYKFDEFVKTHNVEQKMRYTGISNKGKEDFDFDIRFEEDDFYGDLKASDISKKETPGNDQKSLVECIYRYNKFWYIIYEHETNKDSIETGYEATRERNKYIKNVDPSYDKDELSYHQRMKHSVKFVRMTVIELNRINYSQALKEFNQGHQPDGKPRSPKFNINKKVLENDNYVVFRYTY